MKKWKWKVHWKLYVELFLKPSNHLIKKNLPMWSLSWISSRTYYFWYGQISQTMEYMTIDHNEDLRLGHYSSKHVSPHLSNFSSKNCTWPSYGSTTSQIKINSSNQPPKKTCAACQDAELSRCIIARALENRKWCTCVMIGVHGGSRRWICVFMLYKYLRNLHEFT